MRGTKNNALILKIWGLFILVLSIFPCLQSFPASGSFPMSQFFTLGRQSIGASASASVFPMNIQGCFPLGLTSLISMLSKSESEVAQLCPTLCNPMDCSLPGSSIHGIFQARILECIPISFSRRSSQPRDWTQVSHIVGRRFTVWATREVLCYPRDSQKFSRAPQFEGINSLALFFFYCPAFKDWRQEEKGMIEDDMVGWHHWLNRHESEQLRRWWRTRKPGMLQSELQSQTQLSNWTTF